MDNRQDTTVEALLEHLIEHGPDDIATVFGRAFELAMRIERERFLGAGLYERTAARQGYANGYKPKRIDTPAGTVTVDVPKTAGHPRGRVAPHGIVATVVTKRPELLKNPDAGQPLALRLPGVLHQNPVEFSAPRPPG